jgi:hypothetical protein
LRRYLRVWQVLLLVGIFTLWQVLAQPELLPPVVWDNPHRAAFFFGEPVKIFRVTWEWFAGGAIYEHLWVTLQETALAFVIGSALGLAIGLWLGLSPTASALFDPYITAMNAMPRVVLAPIFMVWFGLGIWSKVALGVTLVFFIVFFNVYQGVKEVSPVVPEQHGDAGRQSQQLLRHVYLLRPRRGCSRACTLRWEWPSWARSSASTWARRAAWDTSSSRPRAHSTSTPCSRGSSCSPRRVGARLRRGQGGEAPPRLAAHAGRNRAL